MGLAQFDRASGSLGTEYTPKNEKQAFIYDSAMKLIEKLELYFGKKINYDCIKDDLEKLVAYNNLRDIKRKVEDIVFIEFFREDI